MTWTLRFIVAAALIGAGVLKAADPVPTLGHGWYSGWAATWFAVRALPWIEIAAGLVLLSELPLRWSALPAAAMCLAFVAVTAARLVFEGVAEDCGCFGVLAAPLDQWHLAVVVLLAAASLWLWWRGDRGLAPTSSGTSCPPCHP